MAFAKNLKALMHDRGITAYKLSKSIGAHQTSVANWLSGENTPRVGTLEKVADFFGVSVNDLLKEREGSNGR